MLYGVLSLGGVCNMINMMNERLKELALQAGLEMCGCGCDMPTRQSVKFAELIIRECAEVASSYTGAHYAGTEIEKHFGVV
jgi:hypothetical protein